MAAEGGQFWDVPLDRVRDDGVVTGRNHDHRLGLREDGLMILTSEGLRTTLRGRKRRVFECQFPSFANLRFSDAKQVVCDTYLHTSNVGVVVYKAKALS